MKLLLLVAFQILIFAQSAFAQAEPGGCTTQLTLSGTVGPATSDAFERALVKAKTENCESLLFLINTPGGNLQTTRIIVEKILSSPIPVLCFVWPQGGHAGSAGAIILQACHVSGAATATNIGAATPVSGDGGSIPDDLRNKLVEDTKGWVTGLAKLRGRNQTFAAESITKARSIEADEALKLKVIDLVSASPEEFLKAASGREVKMAQDKVTAVKTGSIRAIEPDLRFRFLDFVTDPQFVYIIFMASLALLYFEITHPGFGAPGILGGIGVIISLIGFHKLEVWWGGVLLILFGLACMNDEAFVTSFGLLGIAGLAAFSFGSILLYDPMIIGERLPYSTVFGIVGTLGVAMMVLGLYIYRTRFRTHHRKTVTEAGLIGRTGKVVSTESSGKGMAEVSGELWRIESDSPLQVGANVKVVAEDGLVLKVQLS